MICEDKKCLGGKTVKASVVRTIADKATTRRFVSTANDTGNKRREAITSKFPQAAAISFG
jgi:hypothetical protein